MHIGRHNCLWCLITSSQLAEPLATRGPIANRTLETLREDHSRFMSRGHGNLKQAKNVIGDILFDIPLENVFSNIYNHQVHNYYNYRSAYLVCTCLLAYSTVYGHCWRRPVQNWTSSWYSQVVVVALVGVPSSHIVRVPWDGGPL